MAYSAGQTARIPKASDGLIDTLRAHIMGNALPPGHRLPSENELIERYQASRGAVREALRLLEVEGLIELKRGRSGGVVVSRPDMTSVSRAVATTLTFEEVGMNELLDFRILIEPEIAANAARHATRAEVDHLMVVAREEESPSSGLGMDVRTADFHTSLAQCSHNGVFSVIMRAFHSAIEGHVRVDETDRPHAAASREAHIRITEAIARGDEASARRHMDRHLIAFKEFLEEIDQLDKPAVPYHSWVRQQQR